MAKAEISWKRVTEDGEKLQVYVHHFGGEWRFHWRCRRFERWMPLDDPPLEDWLELLDAVRRRVCRRRLQPKDVQDVERCIRERFPDAHF